jgi:hypothetical protein
MVLRELLRRGLLDAEVRPAVGVAVDEERDLVPAVTLAVGITIAVTPVVLTMPTMSLILTLQIKPIASRRFWGANNGAIFL